MVGAQALLVSTPHEPPPGLPLPNLNWKPTDRSLDTTVFKSPSLGSAEESGVRAKQGSGGTPSHPCFSQAKSPGGNPSKSTGRALIHSFYGRLIIYGTVLPLVSIYFLTLLKGTGIIFLTIILTIIFLTIIITIINTIIIILQSLHIYLSKWM